MLRVPENQRQVKQIFGAYGWLTPAG